MPGWGNIETLVTIQPIAVDTGSDDRDGMLVMANGMLVAVLVQLATPDHEDAGDWFMEVALGRLRAHRTPTFGSLDDATRWMRSDYGHEPTGFSPCQPGEVRHAHRIDRKPPRHRRVEGGYRKDLGYARYAGI